MLELGVKMLIAYLLGTLLGSLIFGPFARESISAAWAAAMRARPMRCAPRASCSAFLVLIIDIAKGVFAVWWLPTAVLPAVGIDPDLPREWLTLACGFAVIVGHVYPVWFGFRGGKGAATVVGVVAALEPRLLVPMLLCWFVVLLLTGYVGLATMLAGVGPRSPPSTCSSRTMRRC